MVTSGAPLGRVPSGEPCRRITDEWVVVEASTAAQLTSEPPNGLVKEQQPMASCPPPPSPALDLGTPGPLTFGGRPSLPANAMSLEPEEGAKGSASSADRHPILPPPAAAVHLDGQLQPSSNEGRGPGLPSGLSDHGDGSSSVINGELAVVPRSLVEGVQMLKVSAKKVQQRTFRLDADKGTLEWESKRGGTSEWRPSPCFNSWIQELIAEMSSYSQHREHPRAALHRLGAVVHGDVQPCLVSLGPVDHHHIHV